MKRSQHIEVHLLAAVAALTMAGCASGPREVRRCVGPNGEVLNEQDCARPRGGYYGGVFGYPRYVYGGTLSGGRLQNFRSAPSTGAQVVTPGGRTISRGGFGGRGFSGFG